MQSRSRSSPPLQELTAVAERTLAAGHYKEAIAAFKDLLKRERQRAWEESLAKAYLGRAREVAAKKMFQEAAILWENYAGFHPGLAPGAEYLGWLVQAGQIAKLAKALAAVPGEALQSAEGLSLLEAVALLALDNEKLLDALPKDHPIAEQQPLLRKALLAYAERRDGDLEAALRQVSSRSPYRNLRTLLKGLVLWESDPPAAMELLGRIDPGSACSEFAPALAEPVDAETPLMLGSKLQAAIDKLKGRGKADRELSRDLRKAERGPGTRPLFDQVLRHRARLGETASQRACLAALSGCPEAIPLYERAFGPLSEFEQHRIRALHAEAEQDYYRADRHWRACIDNSKHTPAGAEDRLTPALIFRHIAGSVEMEMPGRAARYLEQSLDLDPEDKASYLKLIELYDRVEDPKAAQACLARALEHYPQDPEVLVLAMQSAQRRKAYKQVAAHAGRLLEIDPINSRARGFLLEAHLGHARKQLKAQRLELAARELAEAGKLDPQRRNAARLYLEGLLAYLQGDHPHSRSLWREAWNLASGDAEAWLRWAMEALGSGLPLAGPGKLVAGFGKQHVAGKPELLALARLLGPYSKDSRQHLAQALKTLGPVLKRSFKQADLGEEDFAALCQGLAQADQYELLAECAGQGFKRCRYAPVFEYYGVLAKCKGDPNRLLPLDEYKLRMSLSQAAHARDHRTLALIDGFLRRRDEAWEADFEPDFAGDLPDIDEETEWQIRGRIEDMEKLSPEEQAQQFLGEVSPEQVRNLTPEEVIKRMLGKVLEGTGVDIEQILAGLPLPGGGSGRKSKKKR